MTPDYIFDHCEKYGHLWGQETETVLVSAWAKTPDGWANPHNTSKTRRCKHCRKYDTAPFITLDPYVPSQNFLDALDIKLPAKIYFPMVEVPA